MIMATAKNLKQLIGSYGDRAQFRNAAMHLIEDEERKGHKPLADTLRRLLEAATTETTQPSPTGLARLAQLHDPARELLEIVEPSRSLQDIVLTPETRSQVATILEETGRSEELLRHRIPLRQKFLFCGPPGCGKTLCAEVIARELGLPLYIARLDVIISSFLGETAGNLRKVFESAVQRPCVLFLDEFDSLGRTRADSNEHNELRRVVNSLLVLIDRYKNRGLLLAATNLESSLDNALWRRFDDVLSFEPLGEADIAQLLTMRFKNFPVNFDLHRQASKLTAFTPAEIERVCFDTLRTAILKKRKSATETDFATSLKQEQRRKAAASRAPRAH